MHTCNKSPDASKKEQCFSMRRRGDQRQLRTGELLWLFLLSVSKMSTAAHLTDKELSLLRRSIALAQIGRDRGCHPFGSLLADQDGNICNLNTSNIFYFLALGRLLHVT